MMLLPYQHYIMNAIARDGFFRVNQHPMMTEHEKSALAELVLQQVIFEVADGAYRSSTARVHRRVS